MLLNEDDERILDEERVFAQIKRLDIQFRERGAKILLIRNISHIIQYEKAKNENKY